MKKILFAFLLVIVMSLSFAVPAMANVAVVSESVRTAEYQGITPFTEMTRIYHRMSNGRLQFRVWGMTSGRWLTDWAYM